MRTPTQPLVRSILHGSIDKLHRLDRATRPHTANNQSERCKSSRKARKLKGAQQHAEKLHGYQEQDGAGRLHELAIYQPKLTHCGAISQGCMRSLSFSLLSVSVCHSVCSVLPLSVSRFASASLSVRFSLSVSVCLSLSLSLCLCLFLSVSVFVSFSLCLPFSSLCLSFGLLSYLSRSRSRSLSFRSIGLTHTPPLFLSLFSFDLLTTSSFTGSVIEEARSAGCNSPEPQHIR